MNVSKIRSVKFRWARAAVLLSACSLAPLVWTSAAGAQTSFQCVKVDVNTCTVTIALTSNMNEQITMTMIDSKPWGLSLLGGTGAPYGITGPGSDTGYWDGVPNTTQGTVFTTIFTTGDNEPVGNAVLTFIHITPISNTTTTTTPNATPYTYFAVSVPSRPFSGTLVTITAIVRPVPPPGHVVLQHRVGSTWRNVASMSYATKLKHWTATFRWSYAKRSVQTFRLMAKAAPRLIATNGPSFKITTHS